MAAAALVTAASHCRLSQELENTFFDCKELRAERAESKLADVRWAWTRKGREKSCRCGNGGREKAGAMNSLFHLVGTNRRPGSLTPAKTCNTPGSRCTEKAGPLVQLS